MGIVKNWVVKTGQKAADSVATLASLSPSQLSNIQAQKDQYMSEKPDPTDHQAVELTARLLAENGVEIYNSYLSQIKQLYLPLDPSVEYGRSFDPDFNIRFFNITKWVTDKEENSLEKLVNVYAVLSNEECNIALVFNRRSDKTYVYLAVVNTLNQSDNYGIESLSNRIESAIHGNFPGSEIGIDGKGKAATGRIPCLNRYKNSSIAVASNVPTEKSDKFISQTIEKLLDGYVPTSSKDEYTLILLATPVTDVEERKQELSRIYSGLVPYSQWSTQFTYHQSDSTTGMAIVGVNIGASAGIQHGTNQALTKSNAQTDSTGESSSDTTNNTSGTNEATSDTASKNTMITESTSDSVTDTVGTNESSATALGTISNITNTTGDTAGVGSSFSSNQSINAGASVGPVNASSSVGISEGLSTSHSTSLSEAISEGTSTVNTSSSGTSTAYAVSAVSGHSAASGVGSAIAKTVGKSFAKTIGRTLTNTTSRAITNGISKAAGKAKNISFGANMGANFARSSSVTAVIGKDESITQNFANFEIVHALEVLKDQMKRYETGIALGMWDFAAYVLSDDFNVANNVAHSYLALTQGEESYMSDCAVNLWRNDIDADRSKAKEICRYLLDLRHPQFGLDPNLIEQDKTFLVYPAAVTATATLSGKELAYSLNFPRKSISGLPVFECAEFGRNVCLFEKEDLPLGPVLELGNIVHMHNVESANVKLSLNALSSHAFITGSTGSGKSNTIYHILDSARKEGIHFLVIEPAKGEYKNVFGQDDDVFVYGTNPKKMPLLKINPFSFPDDIHVLEHLDRLVEIFNVCWPMYAAMPAVLKAAIEKSYSDCGWDLTSSTNRFGDNLFPTFSDVARNVKDIINTSEYDTENKGAYKGSLLARIQSLTNGLNGMIFANDEIPASDIFDKNVIVDISRVGSSETKSLLMGMLVLKLSEYRMNYSEGMNLKLRHLTVLEEAHNLLKRTSTEQPVEGSNLLGKSVEMISNAIAEMRTYGEGFIIADQAPGLLDMSAIRNTNTKIILRLPDIDDRELVGKAANLNDDQIIELAKLPCGVAAVYQNEWIQPVLCKINEYKHDDVLFSFTPEEKDIITVNKEDKIEIASLLSNGTYIGKEKELSEIKQIISNLKLDAYIEVSILKMITKQQSDPKMTKLAPIMGALFPELVHTVKDSFSETNTPFDWTMAVEKQLSDIYGSSIDMQVQRDIIQSVITYYFINESNNIDSLKEWHERGGFR